MVDKKVKEESKPAKEEYMMFADKPKKRNVKNLKPLNESANVFMNSDGVLFTLDFDAQLGRKVLVAHD